MLKTRTPVVTNTARERLDYSELEDVYLVLEEDGTEVSHFFCSPGAHIGGNVFPCCGFYTYLWEMTSQYTAPTSTLERSANNLIILVTSLS